MPDPAERALFQELPPAGVILFARNVADPAQLRRLTACLRELLPEAAEIVVDQEGGRVVRLRPPHWRAHPPVAQLGALPGEDGVRAAWLQGALIGTECMAAGFTLACAPVLDLHYPGASDVVGDRAFASDPMRVAALAGAMAAGLLAAGVIPVGKHAPGHGRALVDSHAALPVLPPGTDMEADLQPFQACAHLPWMMTAHLLYPDWDPLLPATLSPAIVGGVIRGRIGFKGVLVSDDLAMGALSGLPGDRAAAARAAGCDIALHCSGLLADSRAVLERAGETAPGLLARMAAARALAARRRTVLDPDALTIERDLLLARVA